VLRREAEKYEVEVRVKELKTRADLVADRARQELRKEILPLEQTPVIAEALSRMLRGVNLSIYGQEPALLSSLAPLVDLLAQRLLPDKVKG
jgi:hypothetical protein